ncbi:hypothetical protein AVEN_245267-1 [Araneus ventricosus]|uniref:Uncharacterized protein n=1 Tax=Araneus ventricosus TaxID=182803 RepID=A0A4Y2EBI8_ARAVE|nr:hypothetical protein AVEN_245267-1 [Araneus ventricosus]
MLPLPLQVDSLPHYPPGEEKVFLSLSSHHCVAYAEAQEAFLCTSFLFCFYFCVPERPYVSRNCEVDARLTGHTGNCGLFTYSFLLVNSLEVTFEAIFSPEMDVEGRKGGVCQSWEINGGSEAAIYLAIECSSLVLQGTPSNKCTHHKKRLTRVEDH